MTIASRIPALSACLLLVLAACDDKKAAGTGDAASPAEQGEEEEFDAHMEDWPDPAQACPDLESAERECRTKAGVQGTETCVLIDGTPTWTPCDTEYHCLPGENEDYGCIGSYCVWDGETFEYFSWQTDPDCETPLVLQFDAAPVTYAASSAAASFDFKGETAGSACHTDWPSAPWLALDRDGSGSIDSGRELFGSGTRLAAGGRASHGFEALAELDSDGDGRVTATDAAFGSLVLWSDADGDRVGALPELQPIAEAGLVAIHLEYTRRGECDARGNCGLERARFEYRAADGTPRIGEVVDVYLACQ